MESTALVSSNLAARGIRDFHDPQDPQGSDDARDSKDLHKLICQISRTSITSSAVLQLSSMSPLTPSFSNTPQENGEFSLYTDSFTGAAAPAPATQVRVGATHTAEGVKGKRQRLRMVGFWNPERQVVTKDSPEQPDSRKIPPTVGSPKVESQKQYAPRRGPRHVYHGSPAELHPDPLHQMSPSSWTADDVMDPENASLGSALDLRHCTYLLPSSELIFGIEL